MYQYNMPQSSQYYQQSEPTQSYPSYQHQPTQSEWNDPPISSDSFITSSSIKTRRAFLSTTAMGMADHQTIPSVQQYTQQSIPTQPQQYQSIPSANGYNHDYNQPTSSRYDESSLATQVNQMSLQQPLSQPLQPLTLPPEPLAYYIPPSLPYTNSSDLKYHRPTILMVPQSASILSKTKLPFGLTVTPYPHPSDQFNVPVVTGPILRCRRCRTYINPYVEWIDHGSKFRCNLCYLINEIPPEYDYDPSTQQSIDRKTRPDLTKSIVEYIAPTEYMVRPPQPNVFLFLIDVSFASCQSGMISTASQVILDSLDLLPNSDQRTKVGFITFDKALHFYTFHPSLKEPQQLSIPDLDEIFLPRPEDLLANLTESRSLIEQFLRKLGKLFVNTQISSSATGSALLAAQKLLSSIGGKVILLQSCIPNIGEGTLKNREDVSMLGSSKEASLLKAEGRFYKDLASECSRFQICVDCFVFASSYIDIASLGCVAKYTGGKLYYYPGFHVQKNEDVDKFASDLRQFLSKKHGLEAVLRIRASKGLTISTYHGSFFIRSADLLALANVNPDHSYSIDIGIEETLTAQVACIQTALLHTNNAGERRIRVLTLALPVTNKPADILANADSQAILDILMKNAVDMVWNGKLEGIMDFLMNRCVDIFIAQRILLGSTSSPHLMTTTSLRHLPVLLLGVGKCIGFRGGSRTPSDYRSYYLMMMKTLPVEGSALIAYPNIYSIHDIPFECGMLDNMMLPIPLNLSSERIERHGIYLLDNYIEYYLWIGPAVSPQLCQCLFGHAYPERLIPGKITLPEIDNDYSIRLRNIIVYLNRLYERCPYIYLVREEGDMSSKMQFLSNLVEDRTESSPSYAQWLGQIREKVLGSTSS